MSEMIERGKRAVNEAWQSYGQEGNLRSQPLSPGCAEALFRAAVAAMREPTEAMLNARVVGGVRNARGIWVAMVDTALDP